MRRRTQTLPHDMPALKTYPDKTCEHCGVTFNRWVRDGVREPSWDFVARRFCCQEHSKLWHRGENHPLYRPQGSRRHDGYIRVARNGKRVYLHRWIMEQHIGRPLLRSEHVHHIDGNPEHNALDNLHLTTSSKHLKMHYQHRKAIGRINAKGQFA